MAVVVAIAAVLLLWATVMTVVVVAARRRSTSMMMDFVTRVGPAVLVWLVATGTADGNRRGVVHILLPHGFVKPSQHVIERVVRHVAYRMCWFRQKVIKRDFSAILSQTCSSGVCTSSRPAPPNAGRGAERRAGGERRASKWCCNYYCSYP